MNPINHATLKQSIRLAELGYPQDETDCVWVKYWDNGEWEIVSRETVHFYPMQSNTLNYVNEQNGTTRYITEWYAAPNAQEIKLNLVLYARHNYCLARKTDLYLFGYVNEAQARADAKIWELENKK